jgi:hypothetical protein
LRATKLARENFESRPFYPNGRLNVATLDSVMAVLVGNYQDLDLRNLSHNWKQLRADADFNKLITVNTTDEKQ